MMFRWEPLNHLLDSGIAELGALSWNECGNDKDVFDYDPDWSRYGRMEATNVLRFIAVRNNDDLVGYASIIITDNLHDKKITCAIIQDIFIRPESRKGGTAGKLLDFTEAQLSAIGIKHISIAERMEVGSVGKWLSRRGYHSNERIWTKPLCKRSIH